jgi:hypothetical protein
MLEAHAAIPTVRQVFRNIEFSVVEKRAPAIEPARVDTNVE